jgi:trans-aconitate methyltransferase
LKELINKPSVVAQEFSSELKHLQLVEMPIEDFKPTEEFDLITSVHGLHYIGDKLSVIQKAASWLKEDGVLVTNLELKSLKVMGKYKSNKPFLNF